MGYESTACTLLFIFYGVITTTAHNQRVKRQFGISFGGNNNGRQDVIGNVLDLFRPQNSNANSQSNNGNVNPFDILNSFVNGLNGGNPPNNSNQPNTNNGTNVLGTINIGNVPIHVTGQNGGIGITVGDPQNECGANNGNCQQGCRLIRRRFRCFCKQGFFLNRDRRTCSDINECRGTNGGCSGFCINTQGSFQCSCNQPLVLHPDGRSCTNSGNNGVQTCNVNNGGCSHSCSQNSFGVTCFCPQGSSIGADQVTCLEVDQCLHSNGGCQHVCTSTASGPTCSCNPGFTLHQNGRACTTTTQTPTCSINNGGCQHFCGNTRNGRKCFCRQGYQLQSDGTSCSSAAVIQICSNNNGGCEQVCNQNIFGVQCQCRNGFQLGQDRLSCTDINECSFNNGGCHHSCINSPGSRTCSCNSGSTLQGDGQTCASAQVASCSQSNGGCSHACNVINNQISCTCQTGFGLGSDGKTCTDINECQQNNGGCAQICNNNQGSFRCDCKPGFALLQGGQCQDQTVTSKPNVKPTSKGCGVNGKKSLIRRIVGGKPADPKDWPWMAALLKSDGDIQYCGGTLITDRHILTAAHCLKPFRASQIKVRLGEYNFETFNDNNPTDFNVVDIRMHENYNSKTQQNDIAILKLDKSTSFSEFIWPICLPNPGDDYTSRVGYVIGWGTIYFGGPVSPNLQEIIVPVWKQDECSAAYPNKVFPNMMCAGLKIGGKDSCQGDSGGPYMIQDLRTHRWQLAGLVSWGIECASPNRPGVYTRVNRYIDWIKTNAIFP